MGEKGPGAEEVLDLIIIGAGLSGINAAWHYQTNFPNSPYLILEAREDLGGTWDLFKYPGIRSDSDIYTFGFVWRPWPGKQAIAHGAPIKKYIRESAELYGIDRRIRLQHKVTSAAWSSEQQHWTLQVTANGESKHLSCRWIVFGTGYYSYEEPLSSPIPGIEDFQGTVIHPQFWPADYKHEGQKIVIVGSGATAVTLVPNLAEQAAHVTMLQRSPSYIVPLPATDEVFHTANKVFSHKTAFLIARAFNLIMDFLIVKLCQWSPSLGRRLLKRMTAPHVPPNVPFSPHFEPRYNPWEQRVCVSPDSDFFQALGRGRASIVTDTIERVTPMGIRLASGEVLAADAIVTATGLKLKFFGGAAIRVDGAPVPTADRFLWHTAMLEGVPNALYMAGFVDIAWTLGADVSARLLCRLLRAMRAEGLAVATPALSAREQSEMQVRTPMALSSTYVQRGADVLPKAGNRGPWRPRTTYFGDMWTAVVGNVKEGLVFERAKSS